MKKFKTNLLILIFEGLPVESSLSLKTLDWAVSIATTNLLAYYRPFKFSCGQGKLGGI